MLKLRRALSLSAPQPIGPAPRLARGVVSVRVLTMELCARVARVAALLARRRFISCGTGRGSRLSPAAGWLVTDRPRMAPAGFRSPVRHRGRPPVSCASSARLRQRLAWPAWARSRLVVAVGAAVRSRSLSDLPRNLTPNAPRIDELLDRGKRSTMSRSGMPRQRHADFEARVRRRHIPRTGCCRTTCHRLEIGPETRGRQAHALRARGERDIETECSPGRPFLRHP